MSFALRSAPVVAAVALVAAGCGGGHTSTTTSQASLRARWHQVVLCARAHGMPGLADPRIDSTGKAIFPQGLDIPPVTRRACQALVSRLIPNDNRGTITPAMIAGLLRFARCMRAHGVHDWPDPSADGTFNPDRRLRTLLKTAIVHQLQACARFNPDPNGQVYFSAPG